jgi:hypothetical protein
MVRSAAILEADGVDVFQHSLVWSDRPHRCETKRWSTAAKATSHTLNEGSDCRIGQKQPSRLRAEMLRFARKRRYKVCAALSSRP